MIPAYTYPSIFSGQIEAIVYGDHVSLPRYRTETSMQLKLMRGVFSNANNINLFVMKFPRISLHSKLVPVHYREHDYAYLSRLSTFVTLTIFHVTSLIFFCRYSCWWPSYLVSFTDLFTVHLIFPSSSWLYSLDLYSCWHFMSSFSSLWINIFILLTGICW